jgi:hypothetical protein
MKKQDNKRRKVVTKNKEDEIKEIGRHWKRKRREITTKVNEEKEKGKKMGE